MTTKLNVPEIIERFREYHKKHPIWGVLHIVLDDGNVNDGSVEYCKQQAFENIEKDKEGYELACILLELSRTQRLKIKRLG